MNMTQKHKNTLNQQCQNILFLITDKLILKENKQKVTYEALNLLLCE